jgi:hypothetical protein
MSDIDDFDGGVADDDVSEQLDDEELGGEYPPDRYIDPDDDRVELPDYGADGDDPDELVEGGGVRVLDQGTPDTEEDLLAEAQEDAGYGALADDDEFTGDETTRDVATERVATPAEEAALHIEDDEDL